MAKRRRRMKTITTKPVGKAIKRTIKQLKALRSKASPRGKKQIDLNVRILKTCYASLRTGCKDIWVITL